MRYLYIWIFLIVLISGVWYTLERNNISLQDIVFGDTTTISVGGVRFQVEVADTPEERQQGLSGRDELGTIAGLLFIFPESDRHGIWMKDMNFPIDVIWISEDLRVIDITYNLTPESYPRTFTPNADARYALETNVDFARAYDIHVGDEVSLPQRLRP